MSYVSIDGAAFRSSLQTMLRQLDSFGKAGAAALDIAMVEYAEKMLKEMKAQAPHRTYKLIRGGHVEGPTRQGEWTVVEILWREPYTNIQDKGGTIEPKHVTAAFKQKAFSKNFQGGIRGALGRFISRKTLNMARLFVPLRPGVKAIKDPVARAAAGYKHGIDFVMARQVTIEGSDFITNVLNKHRTNSARDIGKRAEQLWYALTESKK